MTKKITDHEYIVALVARSRSEPLLARAIETIIGGSPTGLIEDDDLALLESYIAAHGIEHFVAHKRRHHEYLIQLDAEARGYEMDQANQRLHEEQDRAAFQSNHAVRVEEEKEKRAARLAALGLPPDDETGADQESGSPDEPAKPATTKKGKKK